MVKHQEIKVNQIPLTELPACPYSNFSGQLRKDYEIILARSLYLPSSVEQIKDAINKYVDPECNELDQRKLHNIILAILAGNSSCSWSNPLHILYDKLPKKHAILLKNAFNWKNRESEYWRQLYALVSERLDKSLIAVIGVTEQKLKDKIDWLSDIKPLKQNNAIGNFLKYTHSKKINVWFIELETFYGDLYTYSDRLKGIWRAVGESKGILFPTFENKFCVSEELCGDEISIRHWMDFENIKLHGILLPRGII